MKKTLILTTLALSLPLFAAEKPYDFRAAMLDVHQKDVRDASLQPQADEFVFADGVSIAIPADADDVLYTAARDFEDYLWVSMGVAGKVVRSGSKVEGGVAVSFDAALAATQYKVSVTKAGVAIRAKDSRAAGQALYHLEDLMNLRRAPFVKFAEEDRTKLFSPRMAHSGFACDEFPDPYLAQMAHAGLDAILIFIRDVDKTKGHPNYQDVNDVIRRAKRYGLDTYLYSYVRAFVHPRDPGADAVFENSFGRIFKHYPDAKGLVIVGESAEFPSKDPRVIPIEAAKRGKEWEGDTRPMAGYFPCNDYQEWVDGVKRAVRKYSPKADVVFWTYNWGSADYQARMELIDRLPKDISLLVTYEMFEKYTLPNGYTGTCNDYTLSFAGPGKYFVSEAVRAKKNNLSLYAMSNTGGLTWDYGDMPYMPVPFQWKRRWDGMVKAHDDWGLCGTMENHHYGWHPSFVSELSKEAFTRGGMPFDEHIRKIAARDFGEANAEKVVKAWQDWSTALSLQPGTHANQYAIFRAGPAFPFNALNEPIRDIFRCGKDCDKTLPFCDYGANGPRIYRMNYADDQIRQWVEGLDYFPRITPTEREVRLETEALDEAYGLYLGGVKVLRAAAATLPAGARRIRAEKIAGLGEFMGRTCKTAANVKRATQLEDIVLDKKATDAAKAAAKAKILALAKDEYANSVEALKVLEADSALGWEPTMEYIGGVEQMQWKLKYMREHYGESVTGK